MTEPTSVFQIVIDDSKQPVEVNGEKCLYGIIRIGGFSERFIAPLEIWSVSDYKRQWKEGLTRFLDGALSSCMVTGMRDPLRGVFIDTWALYVDHDNVVFQNQILLCKKIRKRFSGNNFCDFIEPRETQTEDGSPISEWVVSRSAIVDFLETLNETA